MNATKNISCPKMVQKIYCKIKQSLASKRNILKIRNTVKYKWNGFNGSKFLWYKFYCILCTRVYCKHKHHWRKVVYDKYFEIIGQLFRAAIIIWLIRSLSMLNDKLSVLNMECWCFNKLLNRVDIFPFNKGVAIFL